MAGLSYRGRISSNVSRKPHQADQVARAGAQCVRRARKLRRGKRYTSAPAYLRAATALDPVAGAVDCRICPLGNVTHRIEDALLEPRLLPWRQVWRYNPLRR